MLIGMDFGTTNSGMAAYDGHELRFVPLDPTSRNPQVARSALYITTENEVFIGRQAIDQYYAQNLNRPFKLDRVWVGEVEMTFAEIGTFLRDVYIDKDIYAPGRLFLSFKMGLSSLNYLGTIVGSDYYYLEDIIAIYLYMARKRAERHFERDLSRIVLGHPVRFSDDPEQDALARQRLLQGAYRAGFEEVYLQPEPIAAAYYYAATLESAENVLIFDFGGGTLDLSVLHLSPDGSREVLATDGIAIAGDVFDRKIVRSKFPPHFGEGTTYRSNGRLLPMPPSFYDAFTTWQDLLLLQMPDTLERLEAIARSAGDPRKISALIKLITSFAALQMFDVAETAKRQLSGQLRATLKLSGRGYHVLDSLTRSEFERLIRPEVQAIDDRVQEVLNASGLRPDQIDAVIRTGGSSQIPAFIQLLESRFGPDRVRDVEAFSSVTGGLGMIAHEIEQGRMDVPAIRPGVLTPPGYLAESHQGGVPVLDLSRMQTFIDVNMTRSDADEARPLVLLRTASNRLHLIEARPDTSLPDATAEYLGAVSAQDRVLLMTTDYRAISRSAGQLFGWQVAGLVLEEIERFREDKFGQEMICAVTPWAAINSAEMLLFLSTLGYGRLMPGDSLRTKLGQAVPYQMPETRGYPAALLPVGTEGEVILMSQAGRGLRLPITDLSRIEARLMSVPMRGGGLSALYLPQPAELLCITASGYAKRLASEAIPPTTEMNTSGHKLVQRTNPLPPLIYQPECPLWLVTNQRLIRFDAPEIPRRDLDRSDDQLLRTRRGERLIGAFYG